MTTLENPVYSSGPAVPRTRGAIFRGAGRTTPSVHKESQARVRPRVPAEPGEGPVPPRVRRGPLSGQLPPTPSTAARADPELLPPPTPRQLGRERAGRELCGGEKTFVSRARTPPLGENACASRLSVPIAAFGASPCPGKGATVSRPRAPGRTPDRGSGRVSAPRLAGPLPNPRPGGARGPPGFEETSCSSARPRGFRWAGAPPSAQRGPLPPCCPGRAEQD